MYNLHTDPPPFLAGHTIGQSVAVWVLIGCQMYIIDRITFDL